MAPTPQELCEASENCVVSGEGESAQFECVGDMKFENRDDPQNYNCISCEAGSTWANTDEADLTCVPSCKYPDGFSTEGLVLGEIAPPTAWDDAFFSDGTQGLFSFEEFYCDEENDDIALIIIVSTGWCGSCPDYMKDFGEIAGILDVLGAKILYWIMENDTHDELANNEFAHSYVDKYSENDTFSVRVGDTTTQWMYERGEKIEEKPGSGNYPYVPFGYLIKRDNMKVVDDGTVSYPRYQDFLELMERLKAGEFDDPE